MTKPPYIHPSVLKKVNRGDRVVRTYSRSSTIIPKFIGLTFEIHNGKEFIPLFVTEETVGHKLGEFSETRPGSKKIKGKKDEKGGRK